MNHPIHFIEFKSGDQLIELSELVHGPMEQANIAPQRRNSENWVVYCNEKKISSWNKRIRPRSKILMIDLEATKIQLNIAYESKELIVLDKPAGLPTQKTLKTFEDNFYDQVRLYFIQQKGYPISLPYVGLHHRLDRGTSGLVLMTKMKSVNKEVSELFKERLIEKEYLAFVDWADGRLPKKWTQKDPIRRGKAKKKKFYFEVGEDGDKAHSEFEVADEKEGQWYLLLARPKTGRTHQLRVHLRYKGHPILGDAIYGVKKSAQRLMLHANKLTFSFKGETVEVVSGQKFLLEI